MKVIKGKKNYELKQGDYLLDNGAVTMFVPKDNSILPMGDWYRKTHITISQTEFKRLLKSNNFILKEKQGMKYYFYKGGN